MRRAEVESRLTRAEAWIDKPLPKVDADRLNLEVSPDGPADFIRTMFDLIVLAFETDTTRVAPYQISAEDGVGVCERFPIILGLGKGHHALSHDDIANWAKYDRFLRQPAERPLGDLILTLLHRFDVPVKTFADNAGEFTEIVG
jgi:hypothetical protein